MALSFNGVSQYLTQSAIASGVPISFACWYSPSNILGGAGLLGIANTSAQTTIAMDLQPTKLRAISTLSNVVAFSDSVASLTTGTWFHCVTVFASNTSRINYLNGVASTVNTTSIIPTGINITVLGALFYPGATSFAFGSIAYPSVWNIALTPTDVANLYNSGLGLNPNNVETSNLISFSALKSGPPYLDSITSVNWTLTGSPNLVSDPFALASTSVFPVSVDAFKTIPNPSITPTNLSDSNDDPLSVRLQKHSDSIVAVQAYLRGSFTSVISFGADPTGVIDSTTAIQNACNVGGLILFPSGTYKISGIITLLHPGLLMGSGISSTIITTTSATADMFFISGSGITITQMQFSSSVTRTAGYCIDCQTVAPSQQIIIRDIQMNAPFNGIHATFLGTIASVFIYNVVSAGSGIVVESVAEQVEIDYVTCTGGSAGLNIVSAPNGVLISHSYFFGMTFGILLQGQGPVGIDSIYINQCFIDGLSTNGYGIYITSQSSTAFVTNIKITESHIANAPLQGIILLTSGGGLITRVNISTTHVGHCGADAIAIASSGVWDVQIKDCILLLNGYAITGHGITIAANTQSFIITGNKIGSTQTTTGNTGFGINLGTGCTNAIISGNDLRGNTLGEQGGTLVAPFVNVNNL